MFDSLHETIYTLFTHILCPGGNVVDGSILVSIYFIIVLSRLLHNF